MDQVIDAVFAATGHRLEALGGYDQLIFCKLVSYAQLILLSYKLKKGISGMAQGWDTAFALACLNRNIPLIAAVPFIGQEKMWKPEAKKLYHSILARAEEVKIVCEGGYATHKYHVRDRWMVDQSFGLLALWNGIPKGGTFATKNYAESIEKPVTNVWPGWISFRDAEHEGCPCGCTAPAQEECFHRSIWD